MEIAYNFLQPVNDCKAEQAVVQYVKMGSMPIGFEAAPEKGRFGLCV